jgi:hypothetical protein
VDHQDEAVAQTGLGAAGDPGGGLALFLVDEAEVEAHGGGAARVLEGGVDQALPVGEDRVPGEGAALEARGVGDVEEALEGVLHHGRLLFEGGARQVAALALPLFAGGGLDLVALLFGEAEQVAAVEGVEIGGDLGEVVAAIDAIVQAFRHEGGAGGLAQVFLDELQQGDGAGGLEEAGAVVLAGAELLDAGHAVLHVGVEGGVLDLVDVGQGDQGPGVGVGEVLAAEELAEELQEAADGLVVTLGAGGAQAQGRGDAQDEINVPGEEGVDLGEVVGGDVFAAMGIELQVGAVGLEEAAQVLAARRGLVEQAAVDHVADVGDGQVDAQAGWEAVLGPGQEVVAGLLFEALLAQGEEPGLAAQARPQGRGEGAQAIGAVGAGQHVLGDLVHHQEEGGPRAAEAEHVGDGLDRFFGGLAALVGARAAGEPGAWVGVALRVKVRKH